MASIVLALYRLIAIGVVAGFAAGFVTGIWVRIAMRISGALTIDRNRRVLTDAGETVGEVTFEGTMALATIAGLIGVGGGVLYVVIRTRLARNPWLRAAGYGLLLLVTFGFVVLEPENPDFHLFGPTWLNVIMYSLAFVICGAGVGLIADRLDRRMPRLSLDGPRRWAPIAWVAGLAPFLGIGLLGFVGVASFLPVATAGWVMLPIAVALVWWLASRLLSRGALRRRSARLAASFALIAPAVVGCFLTVRSIVTILSQ